MTFQQLGLEPALLRALEDEGYTTPTPIQAKAIPIVLGGADLLGIAQTGTGKTAAFALPILQHLAAQRRPAPRKGCRALVLSPTRELASQIGESFRTYGRHLGVRVAVVFGGVGHRPQIDALAKGVDVLVATPGRLLDHMGTRACVLSATEIFVLDEADQMLDLGFVRPIERIVATLPARRQNLFFSATMPAEIAKLAGKLLNEPQRVAVAPVATTVERVNQRVVHIEASRKRALLVELLADAAMRRTLVFTRTKRGADKVAAHLEANGIGAEAIHGNKSQSRREAALQAFRTGATRVLVATDIAARGIDIDAVTHVVNFELPEVAEAYVHRIGRTARAGAAGEAIAFCDAEERDLLRAIERLTRQTLASVDRRGDARLAVDAAQAAVGNGRGGDRRHGNDRAGAGRHRSDEGRAARSRESSHGRNGQRTEARFDAEPRSVPARVSEARGGMDRRGGQQHDQSRREAHHGRDAAAAFRHGDFRDAPHARVDDGQRAPPRKQARGGARPRSW